MKAAAQQNHSGFLKKPLSPDALAQRRANLFATYNALGGDQKTLVNLLAVAYSPVSLTNLNNAFRLLKIRQPVSTLQESLIKSELISLNSLHSSAKLYSCNPLIVELVMRQLSKQREFELIVQTVEKINPLPKRSSYSSNKYEFYNADQFFCAVRIALYRQNYSLINDYYAVIQGSGYGVIRYRGIDVWQNPADVFAEICNNPFEREWMLALPPEVVDATLPSIVKSYLQEWRHEEGVLQLLEDGCEGRLGRNAPSSWPFLLGTWRLLRGEFEKCTAIPALNTGLHAWCTLLREGNDAGIAHFENGLAELRKETGKRKVFYYGAIGEICLLSYWLRNQATDAHEALGHLNVWLKQPGTIPTAKTCMELVPRLLDNDIQAGNAFAVALEQLAFDWHESPLNFLFGYLLGAWFCREAAHKHSAIAQKCLKQALAANFLWPAAELSALIAAVEPHHATLEKDAQAFEKTHNMKLLAHRLHVEESWMRTLKFLSNLGAVTLPTASSVATVETNIRLIWVIAKQKYFGAGVSTYSLELREQRRTGKNWTKGKPVSLKKLKELSAQSAPYLLEQDHQVARHIVVPPYSSSYLMDTRGWLALIGHPHVFWGNSGQALELVSSRPELHVKKLSADQVSISLEPPFQESHAIVLWEETPTRMRVVEITDEHRRMRAALGADGINVPLSAREQVLEALGAVSSLVLVHSDIGGTLTDGEVVAHDPRPRVHLLPEGQGLRVEILVRPFGDVGPYYPPGSGGKGLFIEAAGKRLHTERDLKQERQLTQALVDACPIFDEAENEQANVWQLETPLACLELLAQLQALAEPALIEWPQGESIRLAGQAGLKQLSVTVRATRDWFSVNGEVKLDGGQVLNMQRLLELVGQSQGRFIQLDDGRFLALTDAFRKRLSDLDALTETHGKERRIHALAAPLLEDLAEETGQFVSDKAWRERITRLRDAEKLEPVLPSNLLAELREYQIDGYNWLARLAHWGVGACLADDMGLGKTLQALALILSRAPDGPSLVIAPTSVCLNWHSETLRFAPSLNVQVLGAGDRQKKVEALGSMDLLICSYALLQQESVTKLLSDIVWRTIVLDEAQAIKNSATKRSQSAVSLQGEFKLITTGTPIENHLGELWSLFRFINPGLLGSLESFNRRFAGPIERGDREARQRLKRMVQAFVLRRLKSQVLDELPSRTEIVLTVELSEQERAFYEALRRQAVAELENTSGVGQGEKHLRVLAAIMKLRRACCNSVLASPQIALPSSKLALFGEVLEELLDNRHKVLVFSQFVDHLKLIRAYLQEKNVSHQYLDGQTPAAERKKAVDAFQAGRGDVFLISLKAGGVGLNLTAADYVIHMDPWWNPAVEDQASDRAHRMGQLRPVTIYRLISKDTIEEKIVALHRQKRDLADSVLSGNEVGAKIGTEELLQLIRDI